MLVPKREIIVSDERGEVERYVVEPGEYLIGREPPSDVILKDDLVSHEHARIIVNYDEVLIEDVGSTNGTYVNGQRVSECVRLWPNQKVQIGSFILETRRARSHEDETQSLPPQTEVLRRLLPEQFFRERRYEIGEVIAEGGMGLILNAREMTTQRMVAMKVMKSSLSETDVLRFIEEAQITGQLEHPNIVPLHELGVDENDQVYYTMKMVKGITLKAILDRLAAGDPETIGNYPLRRLLIILLRVCDAIALAHSKGVLHRDLKPANVMIGDFGEVQLMDWGLAKIMRRTEPAVAETGPGSVILSARQDAAEAGATLVGSVVGTPEYMSPEQAAGDGELLDERADIYALGSLLYHILALKKPISGETVEVMLEKVVTANFTPLAKLSRESSRNRKSNPFPHCPRGRIPDSLTAVATKALSLRREDRYESATAFRNEIDAYLGGFATAAERASFLKQVGLLIARNKGVTSVLAVCAVIFLVSGPIVFFRVRDERNRAFLALEIADKERTRAEKEKERAEAALDELQTAAPAFFSEARALADQQKYSEALARVKRAIFLSPDVADYQLFAAHINEAMQDLPGAIEGYKRVLELRPDTSARLNLALCEDLLEENSGELPLGTKLLRRLLDSVIAEKRSADSMFIARTLGREEEILKALFETQLKLIVSQEGWNDSRLERLQDQTFKLDLSDLSVPELSVLKGLPISVLVLSRSGALDLSPLAEFSLRDLDLSETAVSDLRPLSNMRLERLVLASTQVEDLEPIRNMSLKELDISFTRVADLNPIKKLPLDSLALEGTHIVDYSPIMGMSLSNLNVRNTPFEDVAVLRRMPLKDLDLGKTNVNDISALGDMPLKTLVLSGCSKISDLSVLASCQELKELIVPSQIDDVAFLKALPKLERLSRVDFDVIGKNWAKVSTVSEFFKDQGDILALRTEFHSRRKALRRALLMRNLSETDIALRLHVAEDKLVMDLDLGRQKTVSDLSFVRGMPIRNLDLGNTNVADLSPLAECPTLRVLNVSGTRVRSLHPIARLKLQTLDIAETDITDLRPLQYMTTLRSLRLSTTSIANFTPLDRIPLREVRFSGAGKTEDIERLLANPTIFSVQLDRQQGRIELLRRLKNLKFLSYDWDPENSRPAQTREEFWNERDRLAKEDRELEEAIETNLPEVRAKAEKGRQERALRQLSELPAWSDDRLNEIGDGTYSLDLSDFPILNIAFLQGLPISRLWLDRSRVTDISPLSDMPLVELHCRELAVKNWSPLRGLKKTLKHLDLERSSIKSIDVLENMELEHLNLCDTEVEDISSLRGMPLKELNLYGTKDVSDITPLYKMRSLEVLSLASTKVSDLDAIRTLPNLRHLDLRDCKNIRNFLPIAKCSKLRFLNMDRCDVSDLKFLKGASISTLGLLWTQVTDLRPLTGMALESLDIRATPVTDLAPLRAPPLCSTLKELYIWNLKVTDFSPVAACINLEVFDAADTALNNLEVVRGRKLRVLKITRTKVTDLSALAGMPLEWVTLMDCPVTDLNPLLSCPTLKRLVLPRGARDVAPLRRLPALEELSYDEAPDKGGEPNQTAEDFWREYDARNK